MALGSYIRIYTVSFLMAYTTTLAFSRIAHYYLIPETFTNSQSFSVYFDVSTLSCFHLMYIIDQFYQIMETLNVTVSYLFFER